MRECECVSAGGDNGTGLLLCVALKLTHLNIVQHTQRCTGKGIKNLGPQMGIMLVLKATYGKYLIVLIYLKSYIQYILNSSVGFLYCQIYWPIFLELYKKCYNILLAYPFYIFTFFNLLYIIPIMNSSL